MCLLGRLASTDPGFLDRGSNFNRGGGEGFVNFT